MVPLNYNQLYYFYQIATFGSIAAASKKLLISSPALSMQLKELEESLKTPLFNRVAKKLVLTESGTIVFEYAKDIFNLGSELVDTIRDNRQGKQKIKIEIGSQDTIPKGVVDELVAFLVRNKHCLVILKEGNREELVRLQNSFKLDLILTNSVPAVDNSYIYKSKLLLNESLIIVGHPKFKGPNSKSLDWKKQPFILPTYDSSLRQKLDTYFLGQKIDLNVVAEVEDNATEIDLALKGLGLIIVMKRSVSSLLEKKSLVEIQSLKNINQEIWMILGKRKILNPMSLYAMNNFNFDP